MTELNKNNQTNKDEEIKFSETLDEDIPEYLKNMKNQSETDEKILKNKKYKSIEEITREDVIVASSGYTPNGKNKAYVQVFWDIGEMITKDTIEYSDYKALALDKAIVQIYDSVHATVLDIRYDNPKLEEFLIFHAFLKDFYNPNNGISVNENLHKLEFRILPDSMEGKAGLICQEPVFWALTSSNGEDLDTIRFAFIPELTKNIIMGDTDWNEFKWEIETPPIIIEKND
ncbi:MAG: hypothetical protein Q4B23_02130 [Helcococcus sp.]|nr:hypothetical protein [Helcococcus sp.]